MEMQQETLLLVERLVVAVEDISGNVNRISVTLNDINSNILSLVAEKRCTKMPDVAFQSNITDVARRVTSHPAFSPSITEQWTYIGSADISAPGDGDGTFAGEDLETEDKTYLPVEDSASVKTFVSRIKQEPVDEEETFQRSPENQFNESTIVAEGYTSADNLDVDPLADGESGEILEKMKQEEMSEIYVGEEGSLHSLCNIMNIAHNIRNLGSSHHDGEHSSSNKSLRKDFELQLENTPCSVYLRKHERTPKETNENLLSLSPSLTIEGMKIESDNECASEGSRKEQMEAERESEDRDMEEEQKESPEEEGCQSRGRGKRSYPNANTEQNEGQVGKKKSWCCTTCNKCFVTKCKLENHVRVHTGEKPFTVCKESFTEEGSSNKLIRTLTAERPLQCDICGRAFKHSSALRGHKLLHTGKRPLKCSMCKKAFTKNCDLVRHMYTHTGEKPFNCSVCKNAFAQKVSLIVHMRKHTGEKPFECNLCEKSFANRNSLYGHKLLHTGEKPFNCSVCKNEFTSKNVLVGHLRTHTGEKPFNCSVCKKAFSQKITLIAHMRTHTGEKPFECSVCKRAFAHRKSLIVHKLSHTGELPFKCGDCGKTFSQICNLKIHKLLHTGEKPFKCSVCGKAFAANGNRAKHMRTH